MSEGRPAYRRHVAALAHPDPPLTSGALLLRPWAGADAEALCAAFSDPLVLRFSWPSAEAYDLGHARAFLAEQEAGRLRGDQVQWAVVDVPTGALAGGASLYEVDRAAGRASVGYWVAAPARRRGVATTAVRLVAGWAFGTLDTARLQLTCGPDNVASQGVAARCGFTREGVLRAHLPFQGGRRDTVVFSLLADEPAGRDTMSR